MTESHKEVDFLTHIVKEIVDNPADVTVMHEVDKQGVKLTLTVNPADMGKVIGAQGRMATSLRTIMHAFGGRHQAHISVLIADPSQDQQQ